MFSPGQAEPGTHAARAHGTGKHAHSPQSTVWQKTPGECAACSVLAFVHARSVYCVLPRKPAFMHARSCIGRVIRGSWVVREWVDCSGRSGRMGSSHGLIASGARSLWRMPLRHAPLSVPVSACVCTRARGRARAYARVRIRVCLCACASLCCPCALFASCTRTRAHAHWHSHRYSHAHSHAHSHAYRARTHTRPRLPARSLPLSLASFLSLSVPEAALPPTVPPSFSLPLPSSFPPPPSRHARALAYAHKCAWYNTHMHTPARIHTHTHTNASART